MKFWQIPLLKLFWAHPFDILVLKWIFQCIFARTFVRISFNHFCSNKCDILRYRKLHNENEFEMRITERISILCWLHKSPWVQIHPQWMFEWLKNLPNIGKLLIENFSQSKRKCIRWDEISIFFFITKNYIVSLFKVPATQLHPRRCCYDFGLLCTSRFTFQLS